MEAVIASRTSLPDSMLLATAPRDAILPNKEGDKPQARDAVELMQEGVQQVAEKVVETKVEEVPYHTDTFYDNGFAVEEEIVHTQVSTNEVGNSEDKLLA